MEGLRQSPALKSVYVVIPVGPIPCLGQIFQLSFSVYCTEGALPQSLAKALNQL